MGFSSTYIFLNLEYYAPLSLVNTIPTPEETGGDFNRYYITLMGEAKRGLKHPFFRYR